MSKCNQKSKQGITSTDYSGPQWLEPALQWLSKPPAKQGDAHIPKPDCEDATRQSPQCRFTVVTVCFNAEATIERAMQSVLLQTFQDYEFLIIDGASTDNTAECVQKLKPAFEGKLVFSSEPDEGIYDAMNKGVEKAQGEFIVFIGADDWLEPNALELVDALIRPNVDHVAGATKIHKAESEGWHIQPANEKAIRQLYPPAMPAVHQSCFMRTELLRQLKGFDADFTIAADYELFLRAQRLNRLWAFTDEILSNFALGGASFAIVATARDYRRAKRKNGDRIVHAWAVYLRNLLGSSLRR
jgi:glycosyltransferase involved in cell wall biosynthesis